MHESLMEGILLVDKPSGVTSHDVVDTVRRALGLRRVGHTGTLDPMARGLLILLVGSATLRQREFQRHEKTYDAVIRLGVQTDTGDATGTAIRTAAVPTLDRQRVAELLASLRGPCSQTPPAYSAIKVRGRPAYWWARRNTPVTLSVRTIELFEVSLLEWGSETIALRVGCSAGSYIRSLAESIAERLGTVGHLSGLVRLRVGDWSLEDAKPLTWIAQAGPEAVTRALRPVPCPSPAC